MICAFDIEVTKDPLKFPDVTKDLIMMISYVLNGEGYLIVNRQTVSKDIQDFDFAPQGKFFTHFHIFNEPDEESTIRRFVSECHAAAVSIFVTYNGDSFDWPYVSARAELYGISIEHEFGLRQNPSQEFVGVDCVHLDCYRWVKRDSYLPQGSQNLKAVTRSKLGINPYELDPESITPDGIERPDELAH